MLHKETLDFLQNLEKNNNKPWFDENRNLYESAKGDAAQFIQELLDANIDLWPNENDLKAKNCLFRIYRDVRFSKDKIPYKTHFGAVLGSQSKKVDFPGYYIHIQPGNQSFVGGGHWMPEANHLQAIRQEIDYNFEAFTTILNKDSFKKTFKHLDTEAVLKKCPKGYDENNPAIAFLKLKSFTITQSLSDADLCSKNAVEKLSKILREADPFIHFLRDALQ